MKNTKEKICNTARILFESNSYNEVSMRDIADATGIAIGNLTYHFPKKGDLISYMQENLFDQMNIIITSTNLGDHSLSSLIHVFQRMQKSREENTFLYRNMIDIIRDAPQIADNGNKFVEGVYAYLVDCFQCLCEKQLFRSDLDKRCYESLAYNFVYMTQIWMMNGTLYDNKTIPKKELYEVLVSAIVPYLTEAGKDEYSRIST